MAEHATLPLRRRAFLAGAGAAAVCLVAPAIVRGAPAAATLSGRAFGTGWRIVLPAGAAAAELRGGIDGLLARIDRLMSPWRDDSEITRLNRSGAGRFSVSAETARVSGAALSVARASTGTFDPTVGPLVARWGFGPITGDAQPGWAELNAGAGHIDKPRAGLTLDLCGIAKGYALDRIGALLADGGHRDYLVDLGGELATRGRHPSGRPWQVGVEDPRPGSRRLAEVLALDGLAVATSGTRNNAYSVGGRRYSHIIDPASGSPVGGDLRSVSVIAAEAMQADAWATALMAAGAEAGVAMARRAGLSTLFLTGDGPGGRRQTTGVFDSYLA